MQANTVTRKIDHATNNLDWTHPGHHTKMECMARNRQKTHEFRPLVQFSAVGNDSRFTVRIYYCTKKWLQTVKQAIKLCC